ncbi:MAG: NAD(P)H-binding protein, partial [Alphaproteobacteria bacterium]|nr:NAD(P)H-binding protein [Alphaproteobacteria bacterium]
AFDWARPDTWGPALAGVTAVYVAFAPDLAVEGSLETIRGFLDAAEAAGVRRVVLLSGRGEPEAQACEDELRSRGVDWTILRCSWFSQNFSESVFLDGVLAGEVVTPAGLAAEPFLDAEDIADAAFAALTRPGHAGKLYEMTGPHALTFGEAVAEIATATGRPIRHVEIPVEDYRAALVGADLPPAYVELVMYLFTTVLDGRNTPTADGVRQALGRPARSFAAYAGRVAAEGAWTPSA